METLTKSDYETILTSLRYSKSYIESKPIDVEGLYPDYKTKREKLDEMEKLIEKVRVIKNEAIR